MEHSSLTLETARNMILATRGLKAVPFTNTRELAAQAVRSCKYPPLGIRGFGPALATSRWGLSGEAYVTFANENVMVIPIIETKQAVENILEVPMDVSREVPSACRPRRPEQAR
jgi:4-hydroxy-2-oxoheptanedioate aldolase